jgi:hypothetical protein
MKNNSATILMLCWCGWFYWNKFPTHARCRGINSRVKVVPNIPVCQWHNPANGAVWFTKDGALRGKLPWKAIGVYVLSAHKTIIACQEVIFDKRIQNTEWNYKRNFYSVLKNRNDRLFSSGFDFAVLICCWINNYERARVNFIYIASQ